MEWCLAINGVFLTYRYFGLFFAEEVQIPAKNILIFIIKIKFLRERLHKD
jgi:hypothetical protein